MRSVRSIDAVSASLHEILFSGGQQVRADQGAEVYKAWTSDTASRPKAFSKTDVTLEQVAEKARLSKEKRAAEAERMRQLQANLPEAPAEPEPTGPEAPSAQEVDEEEEIVQSIGVAAPLLLPSARIPLDNKRKAGTQSSTERKRLKAKTNLSTISEAAPAASTVAGSLAADVQSNAIASSSVCTAATAPVGTTALSKEKRKLTPEEKSLKKAQEWLDTLDVRSILAGSGVKGQTSHGRELWQATATLESLENNKSLRGCVESVLLKARIEQGYLAEETL